MKTRSGKRKLDEGTSSSREEHSKEEGDEFEVDDEEDDEGMGYERIWADDDSNTYVETPMPSNATDEDFFWYDRTHKWTDDRPPPSYPKERRDPTLTGKFFCYKFPFAALNRRFATQTSTRPVNELIDETLNSFSNGIYDFNHFEAGIRIYYKNFNAACLKALAASMGEAQILDLISKIAILARRSHEVITGPLPFLTRKAPFRTVSMTQEQAAVLLAYAFFCTLDHTSNNFPHFSFDRIHKGKSVMYLEKMKFILAYFTSVTESMPTGTLTFKRQSWKGTATDNKFDSWEKETKPLSDFIVLKDGRIEDMDGLLQVDFANRFLGGGVLGQGCVQEEIRFLCYPELMVSMILCSVLDDTEAIVIQGAQRYSEYTGYASSTRWKPVYEDETKRDVFGRRRCYVVAIDALCFSEGTKYTQFSLTNVRRELNKAMAGYLLSTPTSPVRPIATGNWGCGAFNGNKELKAMIQLLAASYSGRPVYYLTYENASDYEQKGLGEKLKQIYRLLKMNNVTIGMLYSILINVNQRQRGHTVIQYIASELSSRH